jgi:hypothetical protein
MGAEECLSLHLLIKLATATTTTAMRKQPQLWLFELMPYRKHGISSVKDLMFTIILLF